MRELNVPAEWAQEVCVVEDLSPEDLGTFLTPAELARASGFRSKSRLQEWAAARAAARTLALRRQLVEQPLDLLIEVRDSCPFATAAGDEWALSLSHSGLAGAAALGRGRVGVDLERVRQISPATVRFFLSEPEIEVFKACGDLRDAIIHFWSAKEAAFKAAPRAKLLRQVAFSDLRTGPDGLWGRWTDGEVEGTVQTRILPHELVLALARA